MTSHPVTGADGRPPGAQPPDGVADGHPPGTQTPDGGAGRRPRSQVGRACLMAAAAAVAAAAAAGGLRALLGPHHGGLPVVGRVIPAAQRPAALPISGTTLTGQPLNIASWRGHVVVINFWGSWCVPCRAEAPVLRRVATDARPLGVRFAGIDIREEPAAGLAFERHYHIPYPSISDPGDLISARFGVAAPVATPSTYILDARGRIAWAWFGATAYNQLELAVTQAAQPQAPARSRAPATFKAT